MDLSSLNILHVLSVELSIYLEAEFSMFFGEFFSQFVLDLGLERGKLID